MQLITNVYIVTIGKEINILRKSEDMVSYMQVISSWLLLYKTPLSPSGRFRIYSHLGIINALLNKCIT